MASIDTEFGVRDDDLRSDRFFSAAELPFITFKSKFWEKTGEDTFDVTGDFKIRDVTKEVVLKAKSLGFRPAFGPGMRGAMVSGWEISTTINRNDFGITIFPKVLGDDVAVTIGVGADLQNSKFRPTDKLKKGRPRGPSFFCHLSGLPRPRLRRSCCPSLARINSCVCRAGDLRVSRLRG